MKNVFVLGLIMFGLYVGKTYGEELPQGLNLITYGQITHVERGEKFNTVVVSINVGGCLDKLGPVSYITKFDRVRRKHTLYISAVSIANPMSERVRCFAPAMELKTFKVSKRISKRNLKIKFLKKLAE
jgi:hypothetical protein